jgi:hypothetical protein
MRQVPLETANDWEQHQDLRRSIPWRTSSGAHNIAFEAQVDDAHWTIRLNDFPEEPLHTLLIDGDEVMHFDDWPAIWPRPEFPKKRPKDHEN